MRKEVCGMKRAACLLLTLFMLAGVLAGCSKKGETAPKETASKAVEEETTGLYKIGLVQCGSYAPLDTMRESFMSRLDEWGYNETKVDLDYQNAGSDEKKAGEICKQFARDKVDMIVAVGAPAATAASDAVGSSGIKVLFAGVNEPVSALGIQNLSAPERGVTGVSDRVNGQKSVEFAQQLQPNLHSIGLLYDEKDVNAAAAAKAIQDYCRQAGIETLVSTAVNAESAATAAQELCAQVDVLFTPGDSVVTEAAGKIKEAADAAKKPWLAGSDTLVQSGALASFSADYEEVGSRTADMAVQVMVGTQVSQMPVHFFSEWVTWINQAALENHEPTPSEDFLSAANYVARKAT